MNIAIKCPACNENGGFFVAKNEFQGVYRCPKCKAYATIKARNGKVEQCVALSQEDWDKQKAAKEAKKKKD